MKRSLVTLLMIMIGTLGLTACGSDNDAEKQSASSQNDNVLVKVNNQPITESDLELTITSLLGEYQASLLDKAGRHRALESMVMSRVIAQAAQKELTKQDRQKIEKRVAAHREKLLVNYYLRKHASVQPVSQKMVKAYYEKHPDKFVYMK
jgi:hypothetical protein